MRRIAAAGRVAPGESDALEAADVADKRAFSDHGRSSAAISALAQ